MPQYRGNYYMMDLKVRDITMVSLHPSTLTLFSDHEIVKSRVKVHRLFPMRELRIFYY